MASTVHTLLQAELIIVRVVQDESFRNKSDALQIGKRVPLSSSIYDLNPFLDDDGLLRVGGRLRRLQLSNNEVNPLIIPKRCHIAELLSTNFMTLIPNLFIDYEWFPWSICNGCGMPARNAYSSGHLVPSLWDLHMFYLLRPILFRTCRYFTGLCSSNIPRYFLDFACGTFPSKSEAPRTFAYGRCYQNGGIMD